MEHGAIALLLAMGMWCGLQTARWFSGDAIIHLTMAENVANGHWFQFNLGERVGASSSPLFTIASSALWWLGGVATLAWAIKAISLAAWIAVGFFAYCTARSLETSRRHALLAATLATCLPGSTWNWFQGSENSLFAALVSAQFAVLTMTANEARSGRTSLPLLSLLCGAAIGLRAEGVVPACAIATAGILDWRRSEVAWRPGETVLSASIFVAFAFAPYLAQYLTTGEWISASALSRVMMARRQTSSIRLLGVWIYPRALSRLLAYMPLVVSASAGALAELRSVRSTRIAALALYWNALAGLGLYTFAVGAAHTARYLIWVVACLAPLAARGAALTAARAGASARLATAVGLSWICGVASSELFIRTREQGMSASFSQVVVAPARRQHETDALLQRICASGCCSTGERPAVALTEVQQRFFLDERVVVRSLDGVAGALHGRAMRYHPDGCPDVEPFFDDASIVAFLEPPRGTAFVGCIYPGRAGLLNRSWFAKGPAPAGWSWVRGFTRAMLVRDCGSDRRPLAPQSP
jgi:hypothetical protein